jgi:predicted ATPase
MIIDSLFLDLQGDADEEAWPFTLNFVRYLGQQHLTFKSPITMIVGANGSGKSTLIEAIAESYGMDVRGGHGGRDYASALEKGALGKALSLDMTRQGAKMKAQHGLGFFLRAETAFGVFNFMSDMGIARYGERHLGEVSHGEGFLQVLSERMASKGLFLFDEPEAALSFDSCLALCQLILEAAADGSQIICSTHSPLLAACPGAAIIQIDEDGLREVEWEAIGFVKDWKGFMDSPDRYLRHLGTGP